MMGPLKVARGLGLALCLSVSQAAFGQSGEPVAAPPMKVGDTWTYARTDRMDRSRTAKYVLSVKSTSDAGYVVGREVIEGSIAAGEDTYTADSNPTRLEGLTYTPFLPLFSFPLSAGKQWDGRYSFYTSTEVSAQRSSKVEGWETVRVPAGEFRAMRISATASMKGFSGYGSNMQQTLWYAPDVRRFVRAETKIFGGQNARDEVVELLSFKAAD